MSKINSLFLSACLSQRVNLDQIEQLRNKCKLKILQRKVSLRLEMLNLRPLSSASVVSQNKRVSFSPHLEFHLRCCLSGSDNTNQLEASKVVQKSQYKLSSRILHSVLFLATSFGSFSFSFVFSLSLSLFFTSVCFFSLFHVLYFTQLAVCEMRALITNELWVIDPKRQVCLLSVQFVYIEEARDSEKSLKGKVKTETETETEKDLPRSLRF